MTAPGVAAQNLRSDSTPAPAAASATLNGAQPSAKPAPQAPQSPLLALLATPAVRDLISNLLGVQLDGVQDLTQLFGRMGIAPDGTFLSLPQSSLGFFFFPFHLLFPLL